MLLHVSAKRLSGPQAARGASSELRPASSLLSQRSEHLKKSTQLLVANGEAWVVWRRWRSCPQASEAVGLGAETCPRDEESVRLLLALGVVYGPRRSWTARGVILSPHEGSILCKNDGPCLMASAPERKAVRGPQCRIAWMTQVCTGVDADDRRHPRRLHKSE